MKKIIVAAMISIALIALGGIFGTTYYINNKTTYRLNVPEIENLSNIAIEQDAIGKAFYGTGKINEMLEVILGEERTTKEDSIQDYPVNASRVIKLDFNYNTGTTITAFVYEKEGKYYIEQPYNGIYKISKDEYDNIAKYLNE